MDFWQIDSSAPVIEPEMALAYYSNLAGGADLALPEILVATFQVTALNHMARRLGIEVTGRWPAPILWPLAKVKTGGREVAIARLPIGAPATSAALELMVAAGVRTALVAGSAGSLQDHLPTGSLVVPTIALRHEGTSHHYLAAGEPASPAPRLLGALSAMADSGGCRPAFGPVWTTDAPYRECRRTIARLRNEGVLAVEMESAALFVVAAHRSVEAALVLAISDELADVWKPGFHSVAYRRALLTAADLALKVAIGQ